MTLFSKFISKVVGPKGQWRANKTRASHLPASYRTALDALERYLNYLGPGGDRDVDAADLIDLFEQSAANGTPIREVVGEHPVAFIEAFIQNYPEEHWRTRERERFISAIKHIERGTGEPMTTKQVEGPAVRVQGLEKSYKQLHVLRGVDFDVARGRGVALLGSNGAGKTTVVRHPVNAARGPTRGPPASTASMSPRRPRRCGSPSVLPDSSRPSTRSLAGGRTW